MTIAGLPFTARSLFISPLESVENVQLEVDGAGEGGGHHSVLISFFKKPTGKWNWAPLAVHHEGIAG